MSAIFTWAQTVGAAGVQQASDVGSAGNLVNFKNIDSLGTSDYAQYPIPAGQNSFEVWLRGHFSGIFHSISDLRFWLSTNFNPNTGLVVYATGRRELYSSPTNASSSIATSIISSSDPGSSNVSIAGSLSSSLTTSDGYTDYIVAQLRTTTDAAAGDTSLAAFSLSYIED